jgi:signal transduction histidine kinase
MIITAMRDARGRLRAFSVMAHDLTAQKQAESERAHLLRRAEQAARAREDFVQMASHDLRQPLAVLHMQARELLLDSSQGRIPDREGLVRGLEQIGRQATRANAFMNYLLDVSRLDSGGLQMSLQEVDFAEIVLGVTQRFADSLAQSGSALSVALPDRAVGLWDPVRLEQVVANLLGNAIKYGLGQPIVVSLELTCADALLRVRDSGIGISPEHLSNVFERGWRGSEGAFGKGFGLGLWIVRELVRALDGEVKVESKPGEGSTFTVCLPRKLPAAASATLPEKSDRILHLIK